MDYGVAAFIEKDANSILDFVDLRRVGPLALAVNPIDLLLPQFNQMAKYFKNEKLRALFSPGAVRRLSPYNARVFAARGTELRTAGTPSAGSTKCANHCSAGGRGRRHAAGREVAQIVTTPLAESEASAIAARRRHKKSQACGSSPTRC